MHVKILKQVEQLGKYQLDSKGKALVTKYHEKNKPVQFNKKQQLEKLRSEYLKKKAEKANQQCRYSQQQKDDSYELDK